jgi:hypothetical protein
VLRGRNWTEMFENRVLGTIFGRKKNEVAEGWRQMHNENFHNLDSMPYIIRMIKSIKTRWEGHVMPTGG